MHEDNQNESAVSIWARIAMWFYVRRVIKKSRENIRHARVMSAYYTHRALKMESREERGKTDLKAVQLEDSADEEQRFVDFLKNDFTF